jgi:hypothetical protein
MAATTKSELLALSQKEFAKLLALVAPIDPGTALAPDDEGIAIKDIIGHRAHWIGLFLGWYTDGQAGKEVHFPAKGYKWNELPRYNAALRAAQRDLGWAAALEGLEQAHGALLDLIEGMDDTALYGGPMKGAKNNWTPGRWAEAAGPSHYRSAVKYIRKRLKAAK